MDACEKSRTFESALSDSHRNWNQKLSLLFSPRSAKFSSICFSCRGAYGHCDLPHWTAKAILQYAAELEKVTG